LRPALLEFVAMWGLEETKMNPNVIRGILVFQAMCAALFILQVVGDIFAIEMLLVSWAMHEIIEIGTVLGLILGVVMAYGFQRKVLARNRIVEDQLLMAKGEFSELLKRKFDQWDLTSSEADVAMMAIKGFSISEVSQMRGTSEGTIKAQNAAVYRKSGVAGRNQLLISLVEDLIDVGIKEQEHLREV
jgi:DNA-binding CsgD family transcriptional regulator